MSGRAWPSERALVRIQAGSGLVFALFLGLHLANTLLAPLGPETYDGVQRWLRIAYQQPLIEFGFVLAPFLVHIASGVARARRRPKGKKGKKGKKGMKGKSVRWQRRAGWFLAVVVVMHTIAVRGPSLLYGVWLGFEGVAYSLQWVPGYFYPYYLIFGLAAAYHGGAGLVRVFRLFVRRSSGFRHRSAVWRLVGRLLLLACGLLLGLALLAFGGQIFAIEDPSTGDYARLIRGENL